MNLEQFCVKFEKVLGQEQAFLKQIEAGREMVAELVGEVGWFQESLQRMIIDSEFLNAQKPSIWPNEITLYRSQDGSLIVLAYIWESYLKDAVHDHGSWGVIGSLIQPISEVKYERLDDGKKEGFAELKEKASFIINPGETTFVLPLNKGIHLMENRSNSPAVTINVYGRVIRKGYIQFFNPENRTVMKVYPPRTYKQVLAIRTLGALNIPGNGDILKEALRRPLPEYIKAECEKSLSGRQST